MKKHNLIRRQLFPTMIILLLLPPISSLVFYQAAKQFAYNEAIQNLEAFQQDLIPLMKSSFDVGFSGITSYADSSDAIGQSTENSDTLEQSGANVTNSTNATSTNITEQEKKFLYQVSPLAARMSGDAQLMILESHMRVIYPRDEQSRAEVAPLAEEFTQYIQRTDTIVGNDTVEFTASDGEKYLVNIYKVPSESIRIKYLIAFCPTFQIGTWVKEASIMVLAITILFVLLIITILWMTTRSIIQPLHRLCREAERIGSGNFVEIEPDFSQKELEDLRLSMNRMSVQLMRADEVQRNFFQNVSHELRTPLMSISGYAQGIEQGIFCPPQEAAHIILEESVRLTELVNSLLTLSNLESNQQKPVLGPVQIADTIEDCLDRLNGLAIQKGISLKLLPFDSEVMALGEEELISTVLDNLLTNAIRYAKTTVMISVLPKENQVFISVSDDGDGISEKDLHHLFERCYKGKGGNFGIGLAIARSAAQKIDGDLTAANQDDGGAIFTLSLKKL